MHPTRPFVYRAPMSYDLEHQAKRHMERVERRVKHKISSFIWGLVLLPVFLCIFGSVIAGIIWYVMDQKAEMDAGNVPAATGAVATPAVWDGVSTFECAGNTVTTLSNQAATVTASPAIRTRANCRLTLMNMNITAPVVIDAQANSQVTVVGGSLSGSQNSIVAAGNAQVNVTGATVTGPVQRSGLAQVTGVP